MGYRLVGSSRVGSGGSGVGRELGSYGMKEYMQVSPLIGGKHHELLMRGRLRRCIII